jgi:hypothetical protein
MGDSDVDSSVKSITRQKVSRLAQQRRLISFAQPPIPCRIQRICLRYGGFLWRIA